MVRYQNVAIFILINKMYLTFKLIKNKINPLETQVSTLVSFKIFRVLGKNGDFASQRKKVH